MYFNHRFDKSGDVPQIDQYPMRLIHGVESVNQP